MRLVNTTAETLTVDEYIGTGTLQFSHTIKPNGSVYVDATLAKQSKQVGRLTQDGSLAVVSTEEEVVLDPSTLGVGDPSEYLITLSTDTGWNVNTFATMPLRTIVVNSDDAVVVRVIARSSTGFTLSVKNAAGADYTTADVTVYYEFGTHVQRVY